MDRSQRAAQSAHRWPRSAGIRPELCPVYNYSYLPRDTPLNYYGQLNELWNWSQKQLEHILQPHIELSPRERLALHAQKTVGDGLLNLGLMLLLDNAGVKFASQHCKILKCAKVRSSLVDLALFLHMPTKGSREIAVANAEGMAAQVEGEGILESLPLQIPIVPQPDDGASSKPVNEGYNSSALWDAASRCSHSEEEEQSLASEVASSIGSTRAPPSPLSLPTLTLLHEFRPYLTEFFTWMHWSKSINPLRLHNERNMDPWQHHFWTQHDLAHHFLEASFQAFLLIETRDYLSRLPWVLHKDFLPAVWALVTCNPHADSVVEAYLSVVETDSAEDV